MEVCREELACELRTPVCDEGFWLTMLMLWYKDGLNHLVGKLALAYHQGYKSSP